MREEATPRLAVFKYASEQASRGEETAKATVQTDAAETALDEIEAKLGEQLGLRLDRKSPQLPR